MGIYLIKMKSGNDGMFLCDFFDDEPRLWDDELLDTSSVVGSSWKAPTLKYYGRHNRKRATHVLFNPHAIAVSSQCRARLSAVPDLELLPIVVEGQGEFYVLHVTTAADVSSDISVRTSPISGNVEQVLSFPASYRAPGSLFRLRHPPHSAAGRRGCCLRDIFVSEDGRRTIEQVCGEFLECVSWTK